MNALQKSNLFPFAPLYSDLFENNFSGSKFSNNIPAVNIKENEKEFKVEVAAPGLKKEDFRINLVRLSENNFLQTLRNKLTWGLDKRN